MEYININRYAPYVITVVAMKLTVMMMVISTKRNYDPELIDNDLSTDPAVPANVVSVEEDELDKRRYWQLVDNLEAANIEPTGANRTSRSSIWFVQCRNSVFLQNAQVNNYFLRNRLIYNRVPRSGGETFVYLLKELSQLNRFSHQPHKYRSPWNRLF